MTPNFKYLVQELKKLDESVSALPGMIKRGLTATELPAARKSILDVLDEILRLRKMTRHFASEVERHNWNIALDRHQQTHLLTLEEVVRAEFSPLTARAETGRS